MYSISYLKKNKSLLEYRARLIFGKIAENRLRAVEELFIVDELQMESLGVDF